MMTENQVVHAVVEKMTAAFHEQNLGSVMSHYTDNAGIAFEPGQLVNSSEVIKTLFTAAFQLQPQFEYPNGYEVFIAGNTALHIAPWTMQGTTPDGDVVQQSGLSVAVLERQIDGEWRLLLDNPHGQHLWQSAE